ncbi:DNA polymerase [Peribacillus muralis]|uniref:DNA polymerase n=1 Tax=Peribacillus muralis TaxID=264697 RepID=UPI00367291E5
MGVNMNIGEAIMRSKGNWPSDDRELIINIQKDEVDEEEAARLKAIDDKMAAKNYQPTTREIWFIGWTNHNGTKKNGIFQSKSTSAPDKARLQEVYEAIQHGEIPVGVDNMQKFTKAHAMRLYKVLKEKRKHAIIKNIIENMPDNYHLITDFKAFSTFLGMVRQEEEFAIDTETTGLDYFNDEIVGLSFTLPTFDYHCYIPVRHTEGKQLLPEYVFSKLKPILENPDQKKIFFNAKFDVHMLIREDIWCQNVWFDGYVAMKLLSDLEDSYSLKNLATKFGKHFGFEDRSIPYEELFGNGGFQDAQFITSDGRRGIAVYYTCKDTALTYAFYKYFVMKQFERLPKLKKLYFDIERPITEVSVEMEQNGFRIDMEFAATYGRKLTHQIDRLERVLTEVFNGININSNQQLSEELFDRLKLDKHFPDKWKRSVDAKTLKKLSQYHRGVKLLLKYRELSKLYNTYVLPMPEKTVNGYLHGQFLQVQTATGRFASKGPNLQNLPQIARKLIISSPGMVIMGADYSQIEPRVLAHFTQDESMIGAYVAGRDLYIELAMKVFNLEEKYCLDKAYDPTKTFQPRKAIKAVLLGIMYGMGSQSLAGNLGMTNEEAVKIIDDFYKAFPKIRSWMDERILFAEKNEYIETMFGRKRRFIGFKATAKRYHAVTKKVMDILGHLPDFIWHEDYKYLVPYDIKREYWDMSKEYTFTTRRVINTIIQGSAADIMKLAMVETAKICREKDYKMIATIHDEVLFEVPEDISEAAVNELVQAMLSVVSLRTPMKCDVAFQHRWSEEISQEEWFKGVAA